MTEVGKSGNSAAFGFIGVDGEAFEIAATGVDDVIGATADGAGLPGVDDIEHERRMDADGGVETSGGLPGAIADAGDELAVDSGGVEREADAVDGDEVAGIGHAVDEDLEAFDAGIDKSDGSTGAGFFAEDVPGFDGLAKFDGDSALFDGAVERETEFEMGGEPFAFEGVTGFFEIVDDVLEILPDEMGEEEAIVNFRAPADEAVVIGLFPEMRDHRPQEEVLSEAHLGVRGHFEGAHFQEAEATGGGFGGKEFVDAEFGTMGISGGVDQEIPEDAVDEPGGDIAFFGNLIERDFEFVDLIVSGLIDAGGLAGGADE